MLNNAEISQNLQLDILTKGLPRDYRERLLTKEVYDTSEWYKVVRKIQAFREANYSYDTNNKTSANRPVATRDQVNNIYDKEDLNRLASRPPGEPVQNGENNNSGNHNQCNYCGKGNHQSKACYFNPRNRNNRPKRSIKGINAVEGDDSSEFSLDEKNIEDNGSQSEIMSINQIQHMSAENNSDCKYALMRIHKKVTVRGLVDSGAVRCAIDEDTSATSTILGSPTRSEP